MSEPNFHFQSGKLTFSGICQGRHNDVFRGKSSKCGYCNSHVHDHHHYHKHHGCSPLAVPVVRGEVAMVTVIFSVLSLLFSYCSLYQQSPTLSIFCCCSPFSSHSFQISLNTVLRFPSTFWASALALPFFPSRILSTCLAHFSLLFSSFFVNLSFTPNSTLSSPSLLPPALFTSTCSLHFHLLSSLPPALFTSTCSLHFHLLSSLPPALFTSTCSLHFHLLSSLPPALFTSTCSLHFHLLSSLPPALFTSTCSLHFHLLSSLPPALFTSTCSLHFHLLSSLPPALFTPTCSLHFHLLSSLPPALFTSTCSLHFHLLSSLPPALFTPTCSLHFHLLSSLPPALFTSTCSLHFHLLSSLPPALFTPTCSLHFHLLSSLPPALFTSTCSLHFHLLSSLPPFVLSSCFPKLALSPVGSLLVPSFLSHQRHGCHNLLLPRSIPFSLNLLLQILSPLSGKPTSFCPKIINGVTYSIQYNGPNISLGTYSLSCYPTICCFFWAVGGAECVIDVLLQQLLNFITLLASNDSLICL